MPTTESVLRQIQRLIDKANRKPRPRRKRLSPAEQRQRRRERIADLFNRLYDLLSVTPTEPDQLETVDDLTRELRKLLLAGIK